ncbi:peptidase M14 [Erwinia billingiae]|jgi:hypothetical protein|uniref:peptidase M14 n=1 Tax=Erwinia billingiae TaxID=182337 RepID=UPI0030CBF29E
MASEWVEVADNAVKIGLGSALTILGGYLTLKLTQRHELKKESVALELKETAKKTERYVEFLSLSQSLMQTYLYTQCSADGDDYVRYLRIHNEISVTSNNEIRHAAFETQLAVSQFITFNKGGNIELIDAFRDEGRNQVSAFQALANAELSQDRQERLR